MQRSLIVVSGPTASGKSELAVKIAKQIGGRVVSADSRQVYRGLDIGTGKVKGNFELSAFAKASADRRVASCEFRDSSFKLQDLRALCKDVPVVMREMWVPESNFEIAKFKTPKQVYVYKSIPHYCIDIVSPKKQYTVADFKRDAAEAVQNIWLHGHLPIICGGTGHYIDALVFGQEVPDIPPNEKFRQAAEKKSTEELFRELQKKDIDRAGSIDANNRRRIIRALEIIHATGKPVPKLMNEKTEGPFVKVFYIYINWPREVLYERIEKRLKARVKSGMVEEVLRLKKGGLSWKRMEDLGLEYRYIARFSRHDIKGIAKDFFSSPFYNELLQEIRRYAKRQETWFRKITTT